MMTLVAYTHQQYRSGRCLAVEAATHISDSGFSLSWSSRSRVSWTRITVDGLSSCVAEHNIDRVFCLLGAWPGYGPGVRYTSYGPSSS